MLVIPAVDIKGGKAVRLTQGLAEKETIYSGSPVEMAQKWASFGVELMHVVDLDGALLGELKNLDIVEEIVKAVKPAIELGGGIRDLRAIEKVLDAGVKKVCIGTKALDPKFLAAISKSDFRKMVVISIDAKDGFVHAKGWVEKTGITAKELIKEVAGLGMATVNYTDISKDGMLEGPNLNSLKELLNTAKIDIVAAGGITTIDDVKRLKALEKDGLKGMIIGKALYEGKIDLAEAMKICSQKE